MKAVEAWVEAVARETRPAAIQWCDGSDEEYPRMVAGMVDRGELMALNAAFPECYLHRSHPNDVARTEQVTFICSARREDAGPTNRWWSPPEAKATLRSRFAGCMRGRTMHVVPYLLGPAGSPTSQVGVEITDSAYVAVSMRIMARTGRVALEQLGASGDFVRGLHSLGELDPERRFITHFPEERLIVSFGSGYGGNALLSKKCHALRIASVAARDEGWMAEHMLILGVERPGAETLYVAGAFPSACGKTNLAMLTAPFFEARGYRVRTIGDDIAWLRVGEDGRLWAVNPETGCFGVAPGTSEKTNPNAMQMVCRDTLFTNVALTPDGKPWWEGLGEPLPGLRDWQGQPWSGQDKAAHPNSRFTAPIRNCPSVSPNWEDAAGVPLAAILFGGRREHLAPLVYQAFDWEHGVFLGASMASETTAAASGTVGKVRRDPFAMLPFCGYHMGDYFGHWLAMGQRASRPPAIFHVNWFRKGPDGQHLWPGYGENLRVLLWILARVEGRAAAEETPIGFVPTIDSLERDGLAVPEATLRALLAIDPAEWRDEAADLAAFFNTLGDRLPPALRDQHAALRLRTGGTL